MGTVEEKYKYDDYGNLIQVIDPNNKSTNYQRDGIVRILCKTNLDNTTTSYAYNDVNNHLTVTDENGAAVKYIYDGIGNLLYEQDVTTGKYLKTYGYNTDFNLVLEKNNTNGKTDILLELKQNLCVNMLFMIVVKIENNETPAMYFKKPFIHFLSTIDAEVGFDVYVYS